MRNVRASTTSTRTATASNTINAITPDLLLVDERRRAPDLCDFHSRARLEHLAVHVGARRPFLSTDADASAVRIHALEDGRLGADECGGPGAEHRRHVEVGARDRPQYGERR